MGKNKDKKDKKKKEKKGEGLKPTTPEQPKVAGDTPTPTS